MNNQNYPNSDSGETTNDGGGDDSTNRRNSTDTSTTQTNERAEIGIFERFMDSVLGLQHRTNSAPADESHTRTNDTIHTSDTTLTETSGNNSGPNTSRNSNLISNLIEWTIPAARHDISPETLHTSTTQVTDTSNSSNLNRPNNVSLPIGPESEEARAIIITVNYVFSDENNPLNPNRSGSLVLSLPNNSSNRDPEFIQQLIRFATQMAYSSIISGLHKEKGLTKKTFDSYPTFDLEKLGNSKNCVICFDEFNAFVHCDPESALDPESSSKRRKLNTKLEPPLVNNAPDESTKTYLVDCEPSLDHTPIELPCHHIFGKSCLQEWLKDHVTCPLCRKNLADPTDTPPTHNTRNLSMFLLPNGSTVSNLADPSTNIPNRLRRVLRSGAGLQDGTENIAGASRNDHGPLSHIFGYLRRQRQPPANDPQNSTDVTNQEQEVAQDSNSIPDLHRTENNNISENQATPEVNEHNNENPSTQSDSINNGDENSSH